MVVHIFFWKFEKKNPPQIRTYFCSHVLAKKVLHTAENQRFSDTSLEYAFLKNTLCKFYIS